MKAMLVAATLALALALVQCRADAQGRENDFIPNDALPINYVEIHRDFRDYDQLFEFQPATKPQDVPADAVLVEVYQHQADDKICFVGFFYMHADDVNALHRKQVTL